MNHDDDLKFNFWRTSLAEKTSDLEQLSSLCRKLHDEALSQCNFWPNGNGIVFHRQQTNRKLSNSNEDLASLPEINDNNDNDDKSDDGKFSRECRVRRSLQIIGGSSDDRHRSVAVNNNDRFGRSNGKNEFVAERARKFEEEAARRRIDKEPEIGNKSRIFDSFSSIADNNFVKNDPKIVNKMNYQEKNGKYIDKIRV